MSLFHRVVHAITIKYTSARVVGSCLLNCVWLFALLYSNLQLHCLFLFVHLCRVFVGHPMTWRWNCGNSNSKWFYFNYTPPTHGPSLLLQYLFSLRLYQSITSFLFIFYFFIFFLSISYSSPNSNHIAMVKICKIQKVLNFVYFN